MSCAQGDAAQAGVCKSRASLQRFSPGISAAQASSLAEILLSFCLPRGARARGDQFIKRLTAIDARP